MHKYICIFTVYLHSRARRAREFKRLAVTRPRDNNVAIDTATTCESTRGHGMELKGAAVIKISRR